MQELFSRRLYLCVGLRDDMATFLPAVLRGGVDVVQLREKDLPDVERIAAARVMIPICHDFGVPFVMNDSPELALEVGADGVHVGQDDVSVAACRASCTPHCAVVSDRLTAVAAACVAGGALICASVPTSSLKSSGA